MISGQKCFIVVTGASRGLGRSIAASLVNEVGEDSKLLLLARSASDLEETKSILESKKSVGVMVSSIDNETANKEVFDACLNAALAGEDPARFFVLHSVSFYPVASISRD